MVASDDFTLLCNAIALAYHEGRNVRHFAHIIDIERWRYLISLPRNKYSAWRQISTTKDKAKKADSVDDAIYEFENRFHVSLSELALMFADQNWYHSKLVGGNAWAIIVRLILALADAQRRKSDDDIERAIINLKRARHNTGLLLDKLERLEKSLLENKKNV